MSIEVTFCPSVNQTPAVNKGCYVTNGIFDARYVKLE